MTRTVEDCALVMNAVAGYDPKDPASADVPVPDYAAALTRDIVGLRVGVPREYFEYPLDPQVEAATRKAIDTLRELGASVTEVSWPMYRYAMAISNTILMAEATAYHSKVIRASGPQLDPIGANQAGSRGLHLRRRLRPGAAGALSLHSPEP